MAKKSLRYDGGVIACPMGIALNLHAVRCNTFDDNRVHCVFCGIDGPSTFRAVQQAPQNRVIQHESRLDYRFSVVYPDGAKASLVYDDPKVFDMQTDDELGDEFDARLFEGIPASVKKACIDLTAIGFRVAAPRSSTPDALRSISGDGYHTISMVYGDMIAPGKPLPRVRVEFSWIKGIINAPYDAN